MAQASVLSPDEVVRAWQLALPDEVITTFNELLQKHFTGRSASVRKKELLSALKKKGVDISQVSEQQWLEQTKKLYQEKGWKVVFHSPGYDDNFESYYYFEVK